MNGPRTWVLLSLLWMLVVGMLMPGAVHAGYVSTIRGVSDIAQRTERDLTQSGDPITKQRWYITDLQSSVIATVSQTGMIVERVSYSPFGEVRHHPLADLNGDGAVDSADQALLTQNWGNAGIGDLNQDGVVNNADLNILNAVSGRTPRTPPARFPPTATRSPFTAHIYDVESGLLLARFRVYDAQLGRWLSPDPAGFVDGMNLYLYVRGNPLLWSDLMGLSVWGGILSKLLGHGYNSPAMIRTPLRFRERNVYARDSIR